MNKDIKAINESYKLGINNTERNDDGYQYKVDSYAAQRSENEEVSNTRKRIALELNNMTKRASRGLKEDYMYIMTNMKKLHEDIAKAITGS